MPDRPSGRNAMSDNPLQLLALLSLAAWSYLFVFHGRFWRADQRLPEATRDDTPGTANPTVAAIVPARNEADVVAQAVTSLLNQDYPGAFRVVLVDDHSDDGTAEVARAAARDLAAADRLTVLPARDLAPGWTGKLWALSEGLRELDRTGKSPDYVWFTDADIEHDRSILRRLVAKATADKRDLVSLMVRLSCASFWERLLIPPFVYFFQQLYPFPWVNDPRRRLAAAAGGCVLLRRAALERAGGLAPIRDRIIDDCALADLIKNGRPPAKTPRQRIWLGLTRASRSIRPYRGLAEIWRMVARSAYTQLRTSPVLLAATLAGLALLYLVPPLATLAGLALGAPSTAAAAGLAWILMTVSLLPTLRLYGLSPWRALLLPLAALLYAGMTADSARRHWHGRGGAWKGRAQAHTAAANAAVERDRRRG